MILVSSCLAGLDCNYAGESRTCDSVVKLVKEGRAIPVCPEQMGGLTTPRDCVELVNGRAVTKDGRDVTEQFTKGANEVLRLAKLVGCKKAILKTNSPSCGKGLIYDGTFSGKKISGNGLTVQLLMENSIEVYSNP